MRPGGCWTVYDGVLGPWFLQRFVQATGLTRLHYVVLLPPVDVCVARVAQRIGHGFTDEAATRHVHQHFEKADLDDRAVLRGASDVDALVDDVLALVDSGRAAVELSR